MSKILNPIILIAFAAVCVAAIRTKPPERFAEIVDAHALTHDGNVLIFVFRAADCSLAASIIDDLNRVHEGEIYPVLGVLLYPPESIADAEKLVQAHGIRFPVIADLEEKWIDAVRRERRQNPTMTLVRNGFVVADINTLGLNGIAALLPSWTGK